MDNISQAESGFVADLGKVLNELEDMLISKNAKYGDAALNPNQTFSKSSAIELINVRIDDKLSRIRNRKNDEDEDPEFDLIGYLILKRIAINRARTEFALKAEEAKKMAIGEAEKKARQSAMWPNEPRIASCCPPPPPTLTVGTIRADDVIT